VEWSCITYFVFSYAKSGVSGFNPKHSKHHRKEKLRFSLAVGGSAGNTQISSLVLQVTQGGDRILPAFVFTKEWNTQNCI
jgi:hypothetical protein